MSANTAAPYLVPDVVGELRQRYARLRLLLRDAQTAAERQDEGRSRMAGASSTFTGNTLPDRAFVKTCPG